MKGQSTKAGRTTKTQRTRRTEGAGWGKGRRSAGLSAGLGPAPRRGLPATERNRRDRAVPVIFIVAVLCVLCVSVVHFLSRARPTHTAVSEEAPGAAHWAEGQIELGQVDEALGQSEAAAAAYQRAHRLAPASSIPLYRLGSLYLRQGKTAMARDALEQARQKDGAGAPVLTLL